MVLGYDEKRPSEKNYKDFLEKLVVGLERLGNKEISLMIYGSYVRGDYVPGRSDIDALLIFPNEVVIDKTVFKEASIILSRAQELNNIPFQITPTDLKTMQEGRFNSYSPDFEPYFKEESKIIFGSDYRNKFVYKMSTHPSQDAVKFNLRKSRQGLLFSEYDKQINYTRFLERFNKTLDATSRASKQIITMVDGRFRKNRFSALEELSKIFPEVNIEPLIKIKGLYHNLEEMDKIYKNPKELIIVWNDSVHFFESLIKAYIFSK